MLTFGAGVTGSTVTASNIEVYGFDGTNTRSSNALTLDTAFDTDGISYTQNAAGVDDEPSTVDIRLASADSHTHYKVRITSSVTDAATPTANAYVPITDPTAGDNMDDADIEIEKTDMTGPVATAIAFTVHDGSPGTAAAKTGAYALWAGVGDTIRLSLTLNEAAGDTPMITVPGTGRTPTATAMVNTADGGTEGTGDPTTWHHDISVTSTTAETEGPSAVAFTFSITAVDAVLPTANTNTITQANSGLTLSLPRIDTTPPALDSGDSLHTRTKYTTSSGTSVVSATAGIGAELWVLLDATESSSRRR